MKKYILLFFFIYALCSAGLGNQIHTACDGDWNNSLTWLGGVIPGVGDSTFINHNVFENLGLSLTNNYLEISIGAELCGSSLYVNPNSYLLVLGSFRFSGGILTDGVIIINGSSCAAFMTVTGGNVNVSGGGSFYTGCIGPCAPVSSCVPPIAALSLSDSTICVNDCITFFDNSSQGPTNWSWTISGPTSYTSNTQNPTICFSTPGIYDVKLLVSNPIGMDSIIALQLITVNDTSSGSSIVSSCNPVNSPSGNLIWTSSGIYYDTLINANGCDSILTTNFTILSSTSSLIDTSCVSYVSPSGNFTWTSTGMYTDSLFGANAVGCDSIISVNLTVFGQESSQFSFLYQNYCLGELFAAPTISGNQGGVFSIDNGGFINSSTGIVDLIASGPGIYTITYLTLGYCSDTSSQTISFSDCPPAVFISSSSLIICENECIDFFDQSQSGAPSGILSWLWSFPGSIFPSSTDENPSNICYSVAGSYEVHLIVTDSVGVGDSTFVGFIAVEECSEILIPNVFSPNLDGHNDLFTVSGSEIYEIRMDIYNRWGSLIFETKQYNEGWNGRTSAGVKCIEGTYYYIITINNTKIRKGAFTLIR